MVVVLGGGVAAGLLLGLPGLGWGDGKEETALEQVTEKNFSELISRKNRLTVVNMRLDGHPDAEKLARILEELKKNRTFGEQVAYAELDVEEAPGLAEREGFDLESFAGQLNFYAEGERLGVLRGETDPVVVEATIQRYLEGLVERYGPGWLPDVDGMERVAAAAPAPPAEPVRRAAPASAVNPTPGRSTGIPGMQRVGAASAPPRDPVVPSQAAQP